MCVCVKERERESQNNVLHIFCSFLLFSPLVFSSVLLLAQTTCFHPLSFSSYSSSSPHFSLSLSRPLPPLLTCLHGWAGTLLREELEDLESKPSLSAKDHEKINALYFQIQREAVELEHELDVWTRVVYVKIHVPFMVRCWEAEKLHLMMPLKQTIKLARRKKNVILNALDPTTLLSRLNLARNNAVAPLNTSAGNGNSLEEGEETVRPSSKAEARRLQRRETAKQRLSHHLHIPESEADLLVLSEEDNSGIAASPAAGDDGAEVQEITSEFSIDRGHIFKNFDDEALFFTPAQDLRLTRQVLLDTPFAPKADRADTPLVLEQATPNDGESCTDGPRQPLPKPTTAALAQTPLVTNPTHEPPTQTIATTTTTNTTSVRDGGDTGDRSGSRRGTRLADHIRETQLVMHAYQSKGYQLLLADGVYSAVFALHENTHCDPDYEDDSSDSPEHDRPKSGNTLVDNIDHSGAAFANLWLKLTLHWSRWANWRFVCTCVCLCAGTSVFVCLCLYLCVCVCVCVCLLSLSLSADGRRRSMLTFGCSFLLRTIIQNPPALGFDQVLLWRKDCILLCMARILHAVARGASDCRHCYLCPRICLPGRSR